MDEISAAYCAALFEGEGTISIRGNRVDIRLGMTDPDVVEKFRDLIGGGIIYTQRSASFKPHHKTKYTWVLAPRPDVERVLRALLPWFGARRSARAHEALRVIESFYRTCHCGKHFLAKRPEQTFCSRGCKSKGRIFRMSHASQAKCGQPTPPGLSASPSKGAA